MKINPRFLTKLKSSLRRLFKRKYVRQSYFSEYQNKEYNNHEEIQAFVFRELDLLKKNKSLVNHSSKIYRPESFLKFFNNEKYHNPDLYYDLTTDDPDEFPDEF
jgi:hypothetical protein